MTLPKHIERLTAPLQVWEYIAYLQDENERLRERLEAGLEALRNAQILTEEADRVEAKMARGWTRSEQGDPKTWWARGDLNSRPPACEAELTHMDECGYVWITCAAEQGKLAAREEKRLA